MGLFAITAHTLEGDLQNILGRREKASDLYRKARETRIALQSPIYAALVDTREQVWKARQGDEQALDALRASADEAHEKGWKGHALIIERHIADISAFS